MVWDGEGFRNMLEYLEQVRKSMTGAQNNKLMFRWADYGDYRQYSLDEIIESAIKEMDELAEALAILGPSDIRDEVIDVRNTGEFIWDVLRLARA